MNVPRFACLLVLTSTLVFAQSNPVPLSQSLMPTNPVLSGLSQPNPAAQAKIVGSYGKLPLSFEANHGQTDARVKFLSRGSGYTLFLTGDEAVFSFRGSEAKGNTSPVRDQFDPQVVTPKTRAVLRMKLRNANAVAKVTGTDELPGRSNYFIGNDPKKWRSNVPTYAKVKYAGVYSGIDLVYYGNQRQLEYDFVVAPGADPGRIQFDVRGANRINRDVHGDLVLPTSAGEVRWRKPIVYQERDGARQEIDVRYVVRRGHRVSFDVARYDSSKPLYIDPLIYSTYLGGSSDDYGQGIAVDSSGNAYVTGYTSSTDFPTMNPLQDTCGGCAILHDAFVTKLNPTGSALVYSTYLGGSDDDYGQGIAVDGSGNAYVTGYTQSTDFPTMNPLQPANSGGFDAFVAQLDPTGSALVYSTYLGGNKYDSGNGIAVDSSGHAYVTGYTSSSDFPTMNPLQPAYGGGEDAFVAEIEPAGSTLVYSTYLGGGGQDHGQGIVVDSSGSVYVTGYTQSTNFPTTPGAFQTMCKGGCATSSDAFVTEINPAGSALVYSTYLGGGNDDHGDGIALDSSGNAYVTGRTLSITFPVTPGAFQTICNLGQRGCEAAGDAFVTKLNPTGSALVYSTYLGGSITEHGNSIAVDGSGNAYVTGITLSSDFPTKNPLQPTYSGGLGDAFVTKLNPTGSALVYSTYLGGNGQDSGNGIAVDSSGNAYVTGSAGSTNFPTMNPLQPASGGGIDCFVAKINTQPSALVTLVPPILDFGDQPVGTTSFQQASTLTNTGDDTLTISSIQVTGTNSGDFTQHNDCPISVPPFSSCNITVKFKPSNTGNESASVSITDNAPDSPQSLPLTGVGTPPIVKLLPRRLTFDTQPVGTTSSPQTVTLSATGALSITLITTSAEFDQTNNCGSGIPAGGSCQINVTFSPTAPGLQNGTLMITDSGADSPQSVPLSGTGTQPAVTLSPPSLNFGNQTVNIASSPQVSTLKNTGNDTLNITLISVIGANSIDFSETNNCGTTVPAGGSCKITVTFKPSNTGVESASVSITDNAPGSPQSLALSGVGVLPAVTFSPTSLAFPAQVVFTTSPVQKVTLTNAGLGILKISAGGISGQFGGTTTCGKTLAPGASCSISVAFKPRTKGTLNGAISVTDNAPASPQQVPLTGTGTYVQLSPISVNFGNQPVGTTSLPKYITLTNKGSATVNFTGTGITITGTNAGDFAETNNCGNSVASGASCRIKVTFTPSVQGQLTADVSISDDGGGSPQMVPLTGTGTP